MSRAAWLICTLVGLLSVGTVALAQVSESPVKDLTPHGMRKPPPVPANLPGPPDTDPRNLNGVYASAAAGPSLGAFPGGGPPNAGPPGVGPPAGPPPRPPRTNDPYDQCMPSISVGAPGNPGIIVQTPGRLTFIGEGNNNVRRIYLDEKFPEKLIPTRMGYSIGHWEGDTLVIETRGLKTNAVAPSMTTVTRIVERLHRGTDGKLIESKATVDGVDAQGNPQSITSEVSMDWRPDQVPIEVVCEEVQEYSFP